jgi:hypothetical protein
MADPEAPFPTLDDLIEAGWVRTGRGRIFISVEASRAAKNGLGANFAAYETLQKRQYEATYSFEPGVDPELDAAKRSLETKELEIRNISSPRPDWVAARLWEELLARSNDDQIALKAWLNLTDEMGHIHVVPTEAWAKGVAEQFEEAALKLLESESPTNQNSVIERFAREAANAAGVDVAIGRGHFLPFPKTIIGRYLWVTSYRHERAFHPAMGPLGQMVSLVSILLADVERNDSIRPPYPLFDRVMSVLEQAPELMFFFTLYLDQHPMLLADMLFRSSTAAWACLLVWKSQPHRDAWTTPAQRQDDDRNKASLFADVVSVLRFHLNEGAVPPEEVAELVTEIFRYESATADTSIENSNAMRRQLLEELAESEPAVIHTVLDKLFSSSSGAFPGSGAFDGALALVEACGLATSVDPEPLVQIYIAAMTRDEYSLSAHQINALQAKALYELAERTGSDIKQQFLDPLKLRERLSARLEPGANEFTIVGAIARTIRVHLRILSRAIVGHSEEVPTELVEALIETVKTGALDRADRNQVDAFSAGFETDTHANSKDRSVSADLGDALKRLTGEQRDKLLDAVLKIEEPLALVRLLSFVPPALRDKIELRIKSLTPEDATVLRTYTAVQARIDRLLDANLPDVAATYLEAERPLITYGRVPGREVHRLRQELRVHYLRHEWEEIEQFKIPEEVPDTEKRSAEEAIEFFRGLASLMRTDNDPADAEEHFRRLQRSHPHVPAYTVNLHAAKVARVRGKNAFGYLAPEKYGDASRVINEGLEALSEFRDLSADDGATLRLNNASLLLAIKQPAKAIQVLDDIPGAAHPSDTSFIYRAVALARSGEMALANGVLDAGESQFGKTDAIAAAREHLQTSAPYAGGVSTTSDPDVVSNIKKWLHDFSQLNPDEQARVLSAGDGTIGSFLLTEIRQAGAALVDVVPMMRTLGADSIEDDITAIFKEILRGRLGHVQWSVEDQGKGGYTGQGNPGERDLTIRKGASILTVGEAVMTRRKGSTQFTQLELKSHLQKLFAYVDCPVYFHITYEMSGDKDGVLAHLRTTCQDVLIEGFTFLKHEEIPDYGSAPRGFAALYQTGAVTRTVYFLVLDLDQSLPKAAAKASEATVRKARGKRKPRARS